MSGVKEQVWMVARGEDHDGYRVFAVCKTQEIAIRKAKEYMAKDTWVKGQWTEEVDDDGDITWHYACDYYQVSCVDVLSE